MRNVLVIELIFIPLFFLSCNELSTHEANFKYSDVSRFFHYNLVKPSGRFVLDVEELEEVSGLTWMDEGRLGMLHDEEGVLFIYDVNARQIVREAKFEKEGDYEGLAYANGKFWAVKSNGKLYHFLGFGGGRAEEYKNDLNIKNNVEGLCYDPKLNRLLLACKENQELQGDKNTLDKRIYAFDLEKKELQKKPALEINASDIADTFEEMWEEKIHPNDFQPSGIALHPIEDTFYILSSTGRMLVVVNRDGSISGMYPIDRRILRQPEGIAFADDGTLYIASEGRGGKGYFLRYEYNNPSGN